MRQKFVFPFYINPYSYILPLLLYSCFIYNISKAEIVDRIVAVVNEDVITLSELDEELAALSPAIKNSVNKGLNLDDKELREIALDNIIDLRLIEQKAKDYNVSVREQEIDEAYEARRRKMSLEPAEFRNELLKSGLSEEIFRKKLRDSILQNRVISLDVRSKIIITDEMILEYYNNEYTSDVDAGNYYLLQMGFVWNDSDQPDILKKNKLTAKETAEHVRNLVLEGQDFKTLAKKHSNLPSASDGGDIGLFSLDEMAESMQNAVENLQPGEISAIIETSAGFQFFKLLSSAEDENIEKAPFEEVKDEIRKTIGEQKMQEAFAAWIKNLKNQAYIQKL